jgi:hypothetical protein
MHGGRKMTAASENNLKITGVASWWDHMRVEVGSATD